MTRARLPRILAAAALAAVTVLPATAAVPAPATAMPAPAAARGPLAPAAGVIAAPLATRPPAGRLVIGDSLSVGATTALRARGFRVNGKVGRQFSVAPAIIRSYGSRLPRNVVLELGTNGTISLATCRAAVRAAGPQRRVFLVTNRVPRSWERANLRTVRQCNRSYRTARVRVVDWYSASAGHRSWFAADRIHLTAAGQTALARLIDKRVDRYGF